MPLYFIVSSQAKLAIGAGSKIAWNGQSGAEIDAWRSAQPSSAEFIAVPHGEIAAALAAGVIDIYVTPYRSVADLAVSDMGTAYIYDGSGGLLYSSDQGGDPVSPIDPTDPTPVPGYVQNVALLYEAGLAREADLGGLNYWIDRHQDGLDLITMAGHFLESAEFTQRFGDDDVMSPAQFVDLLYRNVLDRPGEAGGVAFWEQQLALGASKERVLLEFAVSPENVAGSTVGQLTEVAPGEWIFG